MHTWYHVAMRWGVKEHTGARLGLPDQVHVRVLVVVESVGCGGRGRLRGRHQVVLQELCVTRGGESSKLLGNIQF